MSDISSLRSIAQQFKTAAGLTRTAQNAASEHVSLIGEQQGLASRTFRKQPERQQELLATADAKLAVATELGDAAISQIRTSIAALRADGDALESADELAAHVEDKFTAFLTYGIQRFPAATPGEAFARNTRWSSNHQTIESTLDQAAARLEAEYVVHGGGGVT